MRDITKAFMDSLGTLESTCDSERIARLFDENAEIVTPATRQSGGGTEAIRMFWDSYRQSFESIKSNFRNVVEQDDTIVMEWISEGTASDGPFQYDGVTLLKCHSEKITSFRTYFNPARVRSGSSEPRVDDPETLTQAQAEAAERRKDGGYQ